MNNQKKINLVPLGTSIASIFLYFLPNYNNRYYSITDSFAKKLIENISNPTTGSLIDIVLTIIAILVLLCLLIIPIFVLVSELWSDNRIQIIIQKYLGWISIICICFLVIPFFYREVRKDLTFVHYFELVIFCYFIYIGFKDKDFINKQRSPKNILLVLKKLGLTILGILIGGWIIYSFVHVYFGYKFSKDYFFVKKTAENYPHIELSAIRCEDDTTELICYWKNKSNKPDTIKEDLGFRGLYIREKESQNIRKYIDIKFWGVGDGIDRRYINNENSLIIQPNSEDFFLIKFERIHENNFDILNQDTMSKLYFKDIRRSDGHSWKTYKKAIFD